MLYKVRTLLDWWLNFVFIYDLINQPDINFKWSHKLTTRNDLRIFNSHQNAVKIVSIFVAFQYKSVNRKQSIYWKYFVSFVSTALVLSAFMILYCKLSLPLNLQLIITIVNGPYILKRNISSEIIFKKIFSKTLMSIYKIKF